MKHGHTVESLIAFEQRVRQEFAEGKLPFLVHLSGGNEEALLNIFEGVAKGDWIFSTHRNHYHYLLTGGDPELLMSWIRKGDSMFVFDHGRNFVSSSILGGLCAVAAGTAWELERNKIMATTDSGQHRLARCWCFLGDGAEENGHLYESVLWSWGLQLPVTYIIEDNDRSVETPRHQRTGGYRLPWPENVLRYHYKPTTPHAGPGLDKMVSFQASAVADHLRRTIWTP